MSKDWTRSDKSVSVKRIIQAIMGNVSLSNPQSHPLIVITLSLKKRIRIQAVKLVELQGSKRKIILKF